MSEPSSDATTPVPAVPPGPPPRDDDPGERGSLEIAFSVVRRIAEHAADLSDGTMRTERRVVGVGLGEAGATARVSGYGDQVDLRLSRVDGCAISQWGSLGPLLPGPVGVLDPPQ